MLFGFLAQLWEPVLVSFLAPRFEALGVDCSAQVFLACFRECVDHADSIATSVIAQQHRDILNIGGACRWFGLQSLVSNWKVARHCPEGTHQLGNNRKRKCAKLRDDAAGPMITEFLKARPRGVVHFQKATDFARAGNFPACQEGLVAFTARAPNWIGLLATLENT